jgi:hypothetical protein
MRPIVQSRVAFTKHQRLYEDILTKQGSLTVALSIMQQDCSVNYIFQ